MNQEGASSISTSGRPKHIFKVVILGNISVGKTSIISRLMNKDFQVKEATVGVEFREYQVQDLNSYSDISLQIWDTSGAERYRAITTSHIRNADAAIVVYDITDRESFNAVEYWIDIIKKCNSDNIIIYLIGNKNDLTHNRQIDNIEVEQYIIDKNIKSNYFVSAKTGLNVEIMFEAFYTEIYEKNKDFLEKKQVQFQKLKERKIKNMKNQKKCCI